jgi:hypothetical protein
MKDHGDVVAYAVSGWHSSLDLTIGSRNPAKADRLAEELCTETFTADQEMAMQLPGQWSIRVYLVDNSLGAECKIKNR